VNKIIYSEKDRDGAIYFFCGKRAVFSITGDRYLVSSLDPRFPLTVNALSWNEALNWILS
jgi:hypothetical protein